MGTGAFDQVTTRCPLAVGKQHGFGAFAAFGFAYAKAPFLLMKVAVRSIAVKSAFLLVGSVPFKTFKSSFCR